VAWLPGLELTSAVLAAGGAKFGDDFVIPRREPVLQLVECFHRGEHRRWDLNGVRFHAQTIPCSHSACKCRPPIHPRPTQRGEAATEAWSVRASRLRRGYGGQGSVRAWWRGVGTASRSRGGFRRGNENAETRRAQRRQTKRISAFFASLRLNRRCEFPKTSSQFLPAYKKFAQAAKTSMDSSTEYAEMMRSDGYYSVPHPSALLLASWT